MNWSHFQTDIFNAFTNTPDSLLIEAVAGSGKTRTLEELARIMGERFPSQRGVMVAFNKSIAMELQARIDKYGFRNVQAMTLHSAGWSAWRRAGGLDWEPSVKNDKVFKIMREILSYEEVKRFGETTRRLVAAAKGIGLVPSGVKLDYLTNNQYPQVLAGLVEDCSEAWEALIDHYGLDEDECQVDCAWRVLARSIELAKETCDFDDMLYMPVIAGVPFDRYDVVLVDEAQDVSGIQMEMIERMVAWEHADPARPDTPFKFMLSQDNPNYRPRPRVIAVGDRSQAIYGFRGAGTDSMDIFQRRFQMRELPLSVTYRCPRSVVLHSRRWVPQLEWSDTAGDGYVGLEGTDWQGQGEIALGAPHKANCSFAIACNTENADFANSGCDCRDEGISKWTSIRDFQPGDAVLCRLTRPLVAAAFAMIRVRIPCRVLGRDIGAGLVAIVKKGMKSLKDATTVGEFEKWLDDYEQRESQRLTDKGKRTQAGLLGDKCDTIRVFIEGLSPDAPVERLILEIERMFVDNGGASGMVTLATVHKAKGLEWPRVFVLDAGEFMPCPWARSGGWEAQQERNCQYIAATRASRELRYITTGDLR